MEKDRLVLVAEGSPVNPNVDLAEAKWEVRQVLGPEDFANVRSAGQKYRINPGSLVMH
jgi:hypothetical protein